MDKWIGNVKLNYQFYSGSDLYSDGAIEDELLEIVKKYTKPEYTAVIIEKNNWPIMYHLSHIRENLIEWLPITPNDTILEIGSGCGALTGCLANKAKSVTCIELSEKRSMINAYRNKDKDNIEILIGNFEDIEKNITEKYDYIMLIGVLEYGEKYISSANPYKTFLENVKNLLKPNGQVIIGIENKFGMKYWSGCKEDHVGIYFEGLEGYTRTKGLKTFSKKELEELMRTVGFNNFSFYYPYPDYKFPMVIYSDNYLPKESELNNNIRNFDSERFVLFDEGKVFNAIINENLFPTFSNSYLICAKMEA